MNRRAAALVAGATALLAAVGLVWYLGAGRTAKQPAPGPGETAVPTFETVGVELYYPNADGLLASESRELPPASSAEERSAQIVAALLEGPAEPDHLAPLADEVTLAGIHLTADGVVYLDLARAELAAPPVSGSRGELLAVYSFVNSILVNVPEARAVALLWNGNQQPTFAGHVDTTRPLPAERSWLAP